MFCVTFLACCIYGYCLSEIPERQATASGIHHGVLHLLHAGLHRTAELTCRSHSSLGPEARSLKTKPFPQSLIEFRVCILRRLVFRTPFRQTEKRWFNKRRNPLPEALLSPTARSWALAGRSCRQPQPRHDSCSASNSQLCARAVRAASGSSKLQLS